MPIERNKWNTVLNLYYAIENDDGTYGEPMLLKGYKTIKIEWEENK